jgi:hypothetical protein
VQNSGIVRTANDKCLWYPIDAFNVILMASLIEELKRETVTMKWVLFTLVGGASNSVLWSQYLFFTQNVFSNMPTFLVYSVSFAFLGILFSIVASLSLPEKRIVAPSDSQIASFPIILIIGFITLYQRLVDYFFMLVMSFLLLYVLGIIQNKFVTSIIGIYGDAKDCYSYSYSVDMSADDLTKKLKEEAFSKATDISETKKLKKIETQVFHTPLGEGCQIFLFLKPNQKESAKQSLLNVIGYERTKYGIRKSEASENKAQMVVSLLVKLFQIRETQKEEEFNDASVRYAIEPTRNKLRSKRISLNATLACVIVTILILPLALFAVGYLQSFESLVIIETTNVLAVLLYIASKVKK